MHTMSSVVTPDSPQEIHILMLGISELDTVLQAPHSDGHASCHAAQDAGGFLDCECTRLVHVQLVIHQNPPVLHHRAALTELFPQSRFMSGIALTQLQHSALGLAEPHVVLVGPILQLVHVPLDGILSFCCVSCTAQFLSSTDLLRVLSVLQSMLLTDIKEHQFQDRAVRDTTHHQLFSISPVNPKMLSFCNS
ncbi:hypothetical protein DUI87_09034 [Hirundo rustica rustica]|uniref:Uncharacterized protein n=1 Tax=Hirundo rustica rustica TaxID=333673 RepID=A0A3M0KT84_HIRRU|nr:hypothetical protein DUI87_09034 [Hirundo rustica rustica]